MHSYNNGIATPRPLRNEPPSNAEWYVREHVHRRVTPQAECYFIRWLADEMRGRASRKTHNGNVARKIDGREYHSERV